MFGVKKRSSTEGKAARVLVGEEWALCVQARPLIRGPALKCRVEGSLLLEALSDNNKVLQGWSSVFALG